jgi:DNA sulfur modification protein DndB
MNIAIDEDDAVAIVTRRLVKESDILKGMVSNTLGSKQINPGKKNDPYITILPALYEVNEILLSAYNEGMQIDNKFKQFRPSDDNLDEYYLFLENIWREMLNCCPDFNYVKSGNKKPGELRLLIDSDGLPVFDDEQKVIPGGNVFMRPIGQYVIAEVIKQAGIQRKSIPEVIQAIMTHVSMDIDKAPWVDLIWNSSKRTIMGTKKEQAIIVAMICHALGLKKPLNAKSKKSLKVRDLKQEYRDAIGDPKASLLQPIVWSGRTIQSHEEDDEDNT